MVDYTGRCNYWFHLYKSLGLDRAQMHIHLCSSHNSHLMREEGRFKDFFCFKFSAVFSIDCWVTRVQKMLCWNTTIIISVITSESRLALAGVAIMSVQTGATILARTGLALILFLLTVLSHPASFTLTAVPLHQGNASMSLECEISHIVIITAGCHGALHNTFSSSRMANTWIIIWLFIRSCADTVVLLLSRYKFGKQGWLEEIFQLKGAPTYEQSKGKHY